MFELEFAAGEGEQCSLVAFWRPPLKRVQLYPHAPSAPLCFLLAGAWSRVRFPPDGASASNHRPPGSIPGGRFPGVPAAPHHLLALPNWRWVPSSTQSRPWGAVSAELGGSVHQTLQKLDAVNPPFHGTK